MSMRRRQFLTRALATTAAAGYAPRIDFACAAMPQVNLGERPRQDDGIKVGNPYGKVPVSFIIDDSTCLVNMGHYCLPQFKEAWPNRRGAIYDKPWKTWPREIPDRFVLEFAEFCQSEGVKGKYSIVPYPACVGWLDRSLPGWSRTELRASLELVRQKILPDWDIHPEMISHTRVLDIKTGRALPQKADGTYWMENGGWCANRSQDEITAYIAYALQLIKNLDLPCEGFTTPGGFGNPAKQLLSLAGKEAIRDVFQSEIPHYFKYVVTNIKESTAPQVEAVTGLTDASPECIVNIPSCTGDYLGSWDGASPTPTPEAVDAVITADFRSGRLVEVIEKGEPACFLTHWPGMYANGTGIAFNTFKLTVRRLNEGFGKRIRWMKLSEIARYWAAKELTTMIRNEDGSVQLDAPFAAPGFTLSCPVDGPAGEAPTLQSENEAARPLERIDDLADLRPGTWLPSPANPERERLVCIDLIKGRQRLQ